MFVQATTSSRPNGKTYTSYLVRESFRTPEGPHSRTVCNITDLPSHARDLIVASLKGRTFVPADQVQLHEALDYGGLAVLNDAWARPVNGACSKPSFTVASSSPAPSSRWFRGRRAPG